MKNDHPHGWSRRRFLAGALGTSAAAALSTTVPSAVQTPGASRPSAPQDLPAETDARLQARLRLMRVALGEEPADTVITGGTLLNTLTGEQLPGWGVAIAGDRIAAVGDVSRHAGPKTRPDRRARTGARAGVRRFALPLREQPAERTRPCRRHTSPGAHRVLRGHARDHQRAPGAARRRLLRRGLAAGCRKRSTPAYRRPHRRVPWRRRAATSGTPRRAPRSSDGPTRSRGIDEVMDLPRVLDGSPRLHGVIQATLDDRRVVAGHGSPPLDVLDGWVAAGIMSSHSARIAEALTMLRKGVHLQLKTERTGEIIRQLLDLPLRDWRQVGLAVDDRTAADLLDRGGHGLRSADRDRAGRAARHGLPDGDDQQRRALAGRAPARRPGAGPLRRRAAGLGLREGGDRPGLRERAPGRRAGTAGHGTSRRNRRIPRCAARCACRASCAPPTSRSSRRRIAQEVQAHVLPPRYFSRDLGAITKTLPVAAAASSATCAAASRRWRSSSGTARA